MADTATRLLTRFNQGTIASVTVTNTAGAEEWDEPTSSRVSTTVQGVSKGVSTEYVDGVNILMTDLEVTIEAGVVEPNAESEITLDGNPAQVLRVDKIPPSGVTVVYKVFVRV